MNYLISAYSVNPYNGSEDGVGWNWVLQYEKNWKEGDRIFLLTKKFNEAATRKGFEEYSIEHIELIIVDVPDCLNWFREKRSMFHHMYYILWQHWAWLWVKKSGIRFDVIHHVTMNDYRIVSEMYKCKSAKIIWGPVGGAQVTPSSLKAYERNILFSKFREIINIFCSWNPFYKRILKKYDAIYCINKETQTQLQKILGKEIELLPELALREEHRLLPIKEKAENENVVSKIVFVGRLIDKKGVLFLIDALEKMSGGMKWELEIYGDGPKRDFIEQKIRNSGWESRIKLMGNMPLSHISEAYKNGDVFVLPSLRETSGNVLIEAMAHALPIVAFDTSFCMTLKERDCGIFINVNQDLEQIKKDYAEAIMKLIQDNAMRNKLGMNGYNFVNTELTWDKKYKQIYGDR